jgi:nucleoid-associated protein YgaU
MLSVTLVLWMCRPPAALPDAGDLDALVVETLVVRSAWVAAFLVAAWHGTTAALAAAAQVRPRGVGARVVVRVAPRLVRSAAGVTCTASILLAPAAGASGVDVPVVRAPEDAPATPAPPPVPAPAPAPAPMPAAERHHVVVAGDNLWAIAAAELTRVTGDPDPSDAVIVPYWQRVIAANRASLRSGDPSLIHPGETVVLPAR